MDDIKFQIEETKKWLKLLNKTSLKRYGKEYHSLSFDLGNKFHEEITKICLKKYGKEFEFLSPHEKRIIRISYTKN